MGREVSHSLASSSRHLNPHSKHSFCSSSESFAPSIIQRNLNELSSSDLLLFAKELKHPGIIALRFYVASPADQETVSRRFCDDERATDNLSAFTRALANAVEWWMQSLELGMCLDSSDISSLCPAIRYSETLRHLSFANSGLGNDMLHKLSSALENCLPLRILNLSGCALTDASSSVIAAIVKGEDQPKCKEVSSSHKDPKYGRQWRQSVILMGTWAPPSPCWVKACKSRNSPPPTHVSGLVALDVSCNSFSDALTQLLCPVLYKKPALRALNLRCNRMTRLGAKPVLDVMKEVSVLRVVDLRCNKDGSSLGVLEDGEHYTTFSTFQAPFWMDAESLNIPVVYKPEKLAPENRMRFTALSRPKMSTQHVSKIRNCTESHNKIGPCTAKNCSRAVGSAEWGSNCQKRHARSTWPEKPTFCDQPGSNSFRQTSPECAILEPSREHYDDFRRSQSAGGFHNYQDNSMLWSTADVAASSRRRDDYSARADHPETQYHHRCKLLNEVHEQQKRNGVRAVPTKRSYTPHNFTQSMLPKGPPLPDENLKELVEWNNFVNQMTETLLNLKDGIDHLSGPSDCAFAEVAQQAATKLHQMPSFFLRSGMLRQLGRSCRVLNSHVASMAKRRRESMRQLNGENEAPDVLCDEAAATIDHDQDTAENQNLASRRNARQRERSKLPPLSISKGTNFP